MGLLEFLLAVGAYNHKEGKKKKVHSQDAATAESADVKLHHGLGQVGADWWNSHMSGVMIKNQFYRPLLPFLFSYRPFFFLHLHHHAL